MGQDRPINALLPGFAQVHVFNSTRIKPFIPVYMPIAMYLGVFAQNTPRSRVSACFHLPSTASTALHVLSKCQTRGRRSSDFAITYQLWLFGCHHGSNAPCRSASRMRRSTVSERDVSDALRASGLRVCRQRCATSSFL